MEFADLRQAEQCASTYKLEQLCKVFDELDKDDSNVALSVLSKKAGIPQKDLKKYHGEAEHFRKQRDDYCTFSGALKDLENRQLRKLSDEVKAHFANKQRFVSKKTMSGRKIQSYARKLLQQQRWQWMPENFSASMTWAKRLRQDLIPRKSRDSQKPFLDFVEKILATDNHIDNERAKGKYVKLFGELKNSKQWEGASRRTRKKLGLKSISVKENGKWKYYWRK
jgi:hypothetical protein